MSPKNPQRPRREHICPETAGRGLVGDLWAYRYALRNLLLKDFRVRYRNMSLGILWSALNPLVMLGVLLIVFSYMQPQRSEQVFPIFILLGLIAFNYCSLCTSTSTMSVLDNSALVKKVIFPRTIIPISVVLSQTIHLMIQLGLLAIFLLLFRVQPAWTFFWLPIIYLVEFIFILGLAFLCSAANVFYRDTQYLVQSSLTILFWFTPIFYSLKTVRVMLPAPLYRIYLLNPLAGCVHASRCVVLDRTPPDLLSFCTAAVAAVVMLVFGYLYFVNVQRDFADKL